MSSRNIYIQTSKICEFYLEKLINLNIPNALLFLNENCVYTCANSIINVQISIDNLDTFVEVCTP